MDALLSLLYGLGLIAIVIGLFNVIIFVHELGHFLAARWRGLQVDRFQIWFGKPIWKKEINGVQYGLGWIPAGGFVALPQMAPMESIEGKNRDDDDHPAEPLPPIKPIDKIIVAFAGPLFSFGLAILAACLVTLVGKPRDFVESTVVGYVPEDGKASKAGLQVGDEIIAVNGQKVNGFLGSPSFDSVRESIMLSEGDQIELEVRRPGLEEPVKITSGFEIPSTRWWERKGLRQLGIEVAHKTILGKTMKGGPAEKAGLQENDVVLAVDGEEIKSRARFQEIVSKSNGKELVLTVERDGKVIDPITVVPRIPTNMPDGFEDAMIGVGFKRGDEIIETLYHPNPFEQVKDSVRMMWVTIAKIASPRSDVGLQHLAGPVGIGGVMFDMLKTDNGWKRLLWFMVLFNVNLAILNMLPLPVLDGGHIVLAIGEMIAGRPVKARLLEVVQTCFALVLLSFFLFITSKDIGDRLGIGGAGGFPEELQWPDESGT